MPTSLFDDSVPGYLDDAFSEAKGELDALFDELKPEPRGKIRRIISALFGAHHKLAVSLSRSKWDWLRGFLQEPIVQQALDLEFARDALKRIENWQGRLRMIRPTLVARLADQRVHAYAAEAVRVFLYGLDSACITMCRAALEQVAKEISVRAGLTTWEDLRKSRVPLDDRLTAALRVAPLSRKTDAAKARFTRAAKALQRHGNKTMHDHLVEPKIARRTAADCLSHLAEVLSVVYA